MRKLLNNWPRLVFIFVPLSIIVVDAAVLLSEQLDSETVKAIRLVKESRSRKENFTVQQYLYTTVYHRKNKGEPINIIGWSARQTADSIMVEFVYEDAGGRHIAAWAVSLPEKSIKPQNDLAEDISWH